MSGTETPDVRFERTPGGDVRITVEDGERILAGGVYGGLLFWRAIQELEETGWSEL